MSDASLTVRVNKDSQRQNDKTMVKIDNEFKMKLHTPTWREKDPSSQGPHSDSACGKQHVGVVCPFWLKPFWLKPFLFKLLSAHAREQVSVCWAFSVQ